MIPDDHWVTIHQYHERIFEAIKGQRPDEARDPTLAHLRLAVSKL